MSLTYDEQTDIDLQKYDEDLTLTYTFFKQVPCDKLKYPNNLDDFLEILTKDNISETLKQKYGLNTEDDELIFKSRVREFYDRYHARLENLIIPSKSFCEETPNFSIEDNTFHFSYIDSAASVILPVYAYIYHEGKGYDRLFLKDYHINFGGDSITRGINHIIAVYKSLDDLFDSYSSSKIAHECRYKADKDFSVKSNIEYDYLKIVFDTPNHGLKEGVKL